MPPTIPAVLLPAVGSIISTETIINIPTMAASGPSGIIGIMLLKLEFKVYATPIRKKPAPQSRDPMLLAATLNACTAPVDI